MGPALQRSPATFADWLAHSHEYVELIRGTLVEKASPSPAHAEAQGGTTATLISRFRYGGRGGPGGRRFYTELDIRLGKEVFRPDVCGYRRERASPLPEERPVALPPDWV